MALNGAEQRNAGVSPDKRIEFRVGLHLGDVVEEGDGDLMGDGVSPTSTFFEIKLFCINWIGIFVVTTLAASMSAPASATLGAAAD